MWLFHSKEQYRGYNIYSLKKYVDKKRIIFNIVVIILTIITLCFIIYYLVDTSLRLNSSKQFIAQIIEFQKQQEELKKLEIQEREARIPKLTEVGKENLKNIYHSENKRVFLTFDDGPSQNTKDILDVLGVHDIKVTFFVLGSQVEAFPETTKRIYSEGHYIANHGYSHKYSSIYQNPGEVLNEYEKCNQIVANIIGVPEYDSHLFRFPGGSVGGKYAPIKNEAITLLEQNNILYIDWNALTGDSEMANPSEEYLMSSLQKTVSGKSSVVILMHDSQAKRVTVDCLPKVIEFLSAQGYKFENFYSVIK